MAETEEKSKKLLKYGRKFSARRVLIISTGGTFNCVNTELGLQPQFNEDELREKLRPVSADCDLTFESLFTIDSANIKPKHWILISDCISKNYKSNDGIIIIHGTDTLAYTSSMLSHMLKGIPIPIIITGSQLSINNPVADALENMRLAIYMAKNKYPGVYVVFNRKIMLGKYVSKTHSKSFNAFESINHPNVGQVDAYGVQIDEKLVPKVDQFFRVKNNICDKVFLLKLTPGLSTDIIDYVIEKEYKGLIIESYGLGGLPNGEGNDFASKCNAAIEKGIKVIVLSQCTYDGVDLNIYETGLKLKDSGIIIMPLSTKEYAYTRLMWELGNN
jgi:L-asparaginase